MKPFIQNVSLDDIKSGYHYDTRGRGVLIQIVDPAMEFPNPKYPSMFIDKYQFKFLDIDKDHRDEGLRKFCITEDQAIKLCEILKQALLDGNNVVVHCVAGMCRSGAVAEVGTIMGFTDTETVRMPNITVKHSMLKYLGLTYDQEEKYDVTPEKFKWF